MKDEDKGSFFKYAKIVVVTIIVMLALMGVVAIVYVFKMKKSESVVTNESKVTVAVIEGTLEDASELITQKYNYTGIIDIENVKKIKSIEIPFTTHKIKASYSGSINSGIDFNELKGKISLDGKKIIIALPEVKVLSNTIDQDNINILDEDNNILNPIKADGLSQELAKAQEEQLQKALDNGLLDKAKESTKTAITKQLSIYGDYEVVFK